MFNDWICQKRERQQKHTGRHKISTVNLKLCHRIERNREQQRGEHKRMAWAQQWPMNKVDLACDSFVYIAHFRLPAEFWLNSGIVQFVNKHYDNARNSLWQVIERTFVEHQEHQEHQEYSLQNIEIQLKITIENEFERARLTFWSLAYLFHVHWIRSHY